MKRLLLILTLTAASLLARPAVADLPYVVTGQYTDGNSLGLTWNGTTWYPAGMVYSWVGTSDVYLLVRQPLSKSFPQTEAWFHLKIPVSGPAGGYPLIAFFTSLDLTSLPSATDPIWYIGGIQYRPIASLGMTDTDGHVYVMTMASQGPNAPGRFWHRLDNAVSYVGGGGN